MSLRKALSLIAPAAASLAFAHSATAAPSLDSMDLDPGVKNQIQALINAPATTPGASFGSPVAFGANLGDVFMSIGGTETQDGAEDDYDGGMTLGFGLGDAASSVGAEFTVGIVSLQDDFGSDGNINFKVHTLIPGGVALAAGVENLGRWGEVEEQDVESGHYVAATKAWQLRPSNPANPMTLITNVGVGDNTFDADGEDFGGFGSLALFFSRQVGAILDYKAERLNAGVSVVPFRSLPINVTIGAANVTEKDDEDMTFAGSVSLSFNFLR